MKYFAWAVLSLGLLMAVPAAAVAQEGQQGAVELGRNYPNPFNPETTIPFALSEEFCRSGRKPVVSIRIYNILPNSLPFQLFRGLGKKSRIWNSVGMAPDNTQRIGTVG